MSITVGQQAPEFSLYNTDKTLTNLSDYKGKKVVLLFFPAAFTGTCTKELCSVRDSIADYNNTNAVVLGISTDSVFVLIKYKEDQHLNFPLLSDYNKEVSALYGSAYDTFNFGMKGTSKRSAFVIDEVGVVKYAEVLDIASEIPNFDNIKAALN